MCHKAGENENRIAVLIVEDHHIFREALRDHLETRPDCFQIIGEVATRAEALRLVEDNVPDIVLLDLALPNQTSSGSTEEGLRAIREIRDVSYSTQVVVLTAYPEDDIVFRAIQNGAVAYLLKHHVRGEDVIDSLLRVHAGDPPVDPEIAHKLWRFFQASPSMLEGATPLDQLTPRETEVLCLIAESKSNQEIADELVIAVTTVKKHVSNILSKLQLKNRIELAIYYRTGQNHAVSTSE